MEAKAKLLGHAVHPMLIPYPLALLTTAIIFDVSSCADILPIGCFGE